jgi:uncharacterized protein
MSDTDLSDNVAPGDPADINSRSRAELVCEYLVKELVDDAEAVRVSSSFRRGGIRLTVKVADGELGRVIGKRGHTAQAIRTVVRAAADNDKATIDIDFED